MAEVFVGLGSNLGDREMNIIEALRGMNKLGPLRRSRLYETEPVAMPAGAPRFLNCVLQIWTDANPRRVFEQARLTEEKMGRDQASRRGSRVIDIDVLLCGDSVVREPDLEVPHPRLAERAFVLVPLAELAPDLVHPELKRTMAELLSAVSTAGVKEWLRD